MMFSKYMFGMLAGLAACLFSVEGGAQTYPDTSVVPSRVLSTEQAPDSQFVLVSMAYKGRKGQPVYASLSYLQERGWFDKGGSGSGTGGIIDSLPNGSIIIDAAGNSFQINEMGLLRLGSGGTGTAPFDFSGSTFQAVPTEVEKVDPAGRSALELQYGAFRAIDTSGTFVLNEIANPVDQDGNRINPGDTITEKSYVDDADAEVRNFAAGLTFRQNLDSLSTNPFYQIGQSILVGDINTTYKIKGSRGNATPDSVFVIEINNNNAQNYENLFGNSENLTVGNFESGGAGNWKATGSGFPDLVFEKESVIGPDSSSFGNAIIHAPGSNNTMVHYLGDTIFAGEQYYFSFWFRAGVSTPSTGVELDRLRFARGDNAYLSPEVSINLITSDTIWRQYKIPFNFSAQDIPPNSGGAGSRVDFFWRGLAEGDTVYATKFLLTRDSSYTYKRTTGNGSIKKKRAYAFLDINNSTIELDEFPQLGTEAQTAQYIINYARDNYSNFTLDLSTGLNFTKFDTTLFLYPGITLKGNFTGQEQGLEYNSLISLDLKRNINAIEILPYPGGQIPVGVQIKNLVFEAESEARTVIDARNCLQCQFSEITIFGNDTIQTGISFSPQTYLVQELFPINNNLYDVRIFGAAKEAAYFGGGSINHIYRSQFHRSKVGVTVDLNGDYYFHGTQIEKSDSIGLNVIDGDNVHYLNGYVESPNFDLSSPDSIGFHIQECGVFVFAGNSWSSSLNTTRPILIDSAETTNIINNNFSVAGLTNPIVTYTNPEYTQKTAYGNPSRFGTETVRKHLPGNIGVTNWTISKTDIEDQPSLSGSVLRDSLFFNELYLRSKKNLVTYSDSLSEWSINPLRITLTENDAINPFDSLKTADRLTLTASPDTKIFRPQLPDTLHKGDYYNFKIAIKAGSEAFNDNVKIKTSIAYINLGLQVYEFSFNGANKNWQIVDTTILLPDTSFQVYFTAQGDADDYFWVGGAQVTKSRFPVDYTRTTDSQVNSTPVINAPFGLEIKGKLISPITDTLQTQNPTLRDTIPSTANYTIRIGEVNLFDTSGGAVTGTVPAGAKPGDTFTVSAGNDAATNNAIIDFTTNGYTINGDSVSRTINTDDAVETYMLVNSTDWRIISSGP